MTRSYSFFVTDTATTQIYTLSLHDALPISPQQRPFEHKWGLDEGRRGADQLHDLDLIPPRMQRQPDRIRSEEHTSELQSHSDLVCRLLLEKKNRGARPPVKSDAPFTNAPEQ